MKKYFQNLKIIVAIFAVLGLLFGPVFWYQSTQFFKEYDDLFKNGIKDTAIIVGKSEKETFRYHKFIVDITVNTNSRNSEQIIAISVNALLFDQLKIGDKVAILSKNETTILVANYNKSVIPPIKKRYFGMSLTLVAGLCLLILIFLKKVSVNNYTKNENT